jgi:hypothetical protein
MSRVLIHDDNKEVVSFFLDDTSRIIVRLTSDHKGIHIFRECGKAVRIIAIDSHEIRVERRD